MTGNSPAGHRRSPALEDTNDGFLGAGDGKFWRSVYAHRHLMATVLAASALVPLSQPAAASPETVYGAPALKAYAVESAVPQLVPTPPAIDAKAEVRKLKLAEAAREKRERERAAAAKRAAMRPKFVAPTNGRFTSGFGARWGTSHNGIDIANSIGTPIVSVADGRVIEAGPASGFGLWVQVEHEDGTVTVYGHMNEITVSTGQTVKAGQQIATIGNRGQSTGPHLHFEVWQGGGAKIDPLSWLSARGVSV